MKAVTLFLPYVLPYATACPKPAARQAIVDAAIEFCEKSCLLQATLDPLSTEEGVTEYELFLPAKHELVRVMRAWFKGTELSPAALGAINNPSAWRATIPGVQAVSGDPAEFYQAGVRSIGVYPPPQADEDDTLTVRAAIKPLRAATQLADELLEDWVEVIAAGALQRLHSTPGQPYTDQSLAADRYMRFLAGINQARNQATRGRTQGELRVQMRPFA